MDLFEIDQVRFKDILSYPHIAIAENQTTFVCGKSGSGKSTLLKLLNGTVSPSEGQILFRGKPLNEQEPIVLRREVLLVSQSVFLFDDTIRGNFREFYTVRGEKPPEDAQILHYMKLCCADFSLDASCRELSGGERQRVFVAICLSFLPKVLMLDEPTSALDGKTADAFMQQIKTTCRDGNISLIVITHDKSLAEQYADTIIDLNTEAVHE